MPEERLVVLPEILSLDQGAMVEPAAVGAHSTRRTSGIKGKNVVVSGAGNYRQFGGSICKGTWCQKSFNYGYK